MRVNPSLLLACLFGWAATSTAHAQQTTFRSGVELLAVDVTVVDDRGRPVTDLGAAEFHVTVDGQPRKVVSAEYVSLASTEEQRARQPENPYFSSNAGPRPGRLILIVADQGNIRTGAARAVMAATERFVNTLGPADRVALAAIPPPGPAVDFTTNHEQVRQGLSRVMGHAFRSRGTHNIGVSEAMALEQHSDPWAIKALMDRECGTYSPGSFERDRCEREVETEANGIIMEIREQSGQSVRALRTMLIQLADVDGPKSLILVSEGLVLEGLGAEVVELARLAASANVAINVIMLDVSRVDVTESQLPPTPGPDRDLQIQGLELLAGAARGSLFRIAGSADYAFDRISLELSGHYLLGVEPVPTDRDGKRHKIRVEVRRRGTTVRARSEFLLTGTPLTGMTDEEQIARLLRSPFSTPDLPLRATTYAYRDDSSAKVRIILAAEVELDDGETDMAVGFTLVDEEGRLAATGFERKTLSRRGDDPASPLTYAGAMLVEPGTYTLKLAMIGKSGRRGSVEHEVQAWKMSDEELAFGDLIVGDLPARGASISPGVEAQVTTGQLAAYLELYSNRPETFRDVVVDIDVLDREGGQPLANADAMLAGTDGDSLRTARAVVSAALLPPGRYIARARISSSGKTVGELARPFQVAPGPAAAAAAAANGASSAPASPAAPRLGSTVLLPIPARFESAQVLRPDIVDYFLVALERSRPAATPASVKAAIKQARGGKLEGTAMQAFEGGDQLTASFLRGLETLKKGQLDPAATQFQAALRISPDFFPARFYLGACYAAAGRDQEAAGAWQAAVGGPDRAPVMFDVLGDAWLRLENAPLAIETLRDALRRFPDNDGYRRRLGIAYLLAGEHAQASSTLDPYLTRRPEDHEALLVAIQALYAVHAAGAQVGTPAEDRERMRRYAAAYAAAKGPHAALVTRWSEFVQNQKN